MEIPDYSISSNNSNKYPEQMLSEDQQEQQKQEIDELSKSSSLKEKSAKLLIQAVICFILPVTALGTYTIFVHSYFSAFYILMIGILIILTIERFYEEVLMPGLDQKNDLQSNLIDNQRVKFKDYRHIFWIISIIFNACLFVFKLVILIIYNAKGGDGYLPFTASENVYEDLELFIFKHGQTFEPIVRMFLPTTAFLVLSIVILLIRKPKDSISFKEIKLSQKRTKSISLCKIIIWIALITVQAFNVSLSTYTFLAIFLCSLGSLSLEKKLAEKANKIIKHTLKFTVLLTLVAQYLCSADSFLSNVQGIKWTFQFLGFNLINEFTDQLSQTPFYFISLWTLLIIDVIMISLIKYDRLITKVRDISEQFSSKYQGNIPSDQELFLKNEFEPAPINQNQPEGIHSKNNLIQFDTSQLSAEQRHSNNKELHVLPEISENNLFQAINEQNQFIDTENIIIEGNVNLTPANSSIKEDEKQSEKKISVIQLTAQNYLRWIKKRLLEFINSFHNEIFTFRVIQILAICIAQRYFTYYSLGLVVWVLLTGITINSRFTEISSCILAIPSLFLNLVFLIFANIQNNDFIPSWSNTQLGFMTYQKAWIEICILNGLLFLFFFYISQVKQARLNRIKSKQLKKTGVKFGQKKLKSAVTIDDKLSKQTQPQNNIFKSLATQDKSKNSKTEKSQVSYFLIFQAFLLKYSYIVALFMVYWISFYAVNLIHVILVGLFLVFFMNMNTMLLVEKKTVFQPSESQNTVQTSTVSQADLSQPPDSANELNKEQIKMKLVSFGRKYWIVMVIYVEIIMICRYVYFLALEDQVETGSFTAQLLDFIGVSYEYSFPVHVGLTDDDAAYSSIIWVLFYFIILQYDSYKSQIYMKYSHKILELFAAKPLIKKIFPKFLQFLDKLNVIFYSVLIWVSFITISTVLVLVDYSLINTYLVFFIFGFITYFVKVTSTKSTSYIYIQRIWLFFTINLILISFSRYVFQLTASAFVPNYIIDKESPSYQTFESNRKIYGLYSDDQTVNLRLKFLPGMINIFFAILNLEYFRLISEGCRISIEREKKLKLEKQNSALREAERQNSVSSQGGVSVSRKNSDVSVDESLNEEQTEKQENKYQKLKAKETLRIYEEFVLAQVLEKFTWLQWPVLQFSKLFTDIMSLVVIISCVYFKISVSMLILLVIYMFFYAKTHGAIQDCLKGYDIYNKVSDKIIHFKQTYLQSPSRNSASVIQSLDQKNKHDLSLELLKDLQDVTFKSLEIKVQTKQKVWIYSFVWSIACVILTYTSSFWVTEYADGIIGEVSVYIQWILFVFGTQVTEFNQIDNLWRNIYFYLLMFWLNIIDKKCLLFLEEIHFNKVQSRSQSNQEPPIEIIRESSEEQIERRSLNDEPLPEEDEVSEEANRGTQCKLNSLFFQYELNTHSHVLEIFFSKEIPQEQKKKGGLQQLDEIPEDLDEDPLLLEQGQENNGLVDAEVKIDLKGKEYLKAIENLNSNAFQIPGKDILEQPQEKEIRQYSIRGSQSINNNDSGSIINHLPLDERDFNLMTSEEREFYRVGRFFKLKEQYLEMRILFATVQIIERIYVLILFFDSNNKQNIFSWIYLALAAYFWIKTTKSQMIKALNRWSISIVVIQYIFLLLNINNTTSLIPIPQNLQDLKSMSVAETFLDSASIKTYLGFDSSENILLLLNALIIFLIEIYFVYFIKICIVIVNRIAQKQTLFDMPSYLQYINFRAWKSAYYTFINAVYTSIMMNLQAILLILFIVLSCLSFEIFNLMITVLCILFFFFYELTIDPSDKQKTSKKQLFFFAIIRAISFFALVVFTTLKIPLIDNWISNKDNDPISSSRRFLKEEVEAFHVTEKIFILFFIQLIFDLMTSSDYMEYTKDHLISDKLRARLRLKCIAYKYNNRKLHLIKQRFKENEDLILNVEEVQRQLDRWHKSIDKTTSGIGQKSDSETNSKLVEQTLAQQKAAANASKTLKSTEKSKKNKIEALLRKSIGWLSEYRNEQLFENEIGLLNYVIANNPYLIDCIKVELLSFLEVDNTLLLTILDFLDTLYARIYQIAAEKGFEEFKSENITKTLKNAIQSPEIKDTYASLRKSHSMKSEEITLFRESSKIYSNYSNIKLHDSASKFQIYNLDEEKWLNSKYQKGLIDLAKTALKYLGQVIITWWSYVCFLFFLFYYYNNDGIMSAFFPFLVFLNFMVEESGGSVFIWKTSFLYVSLMIVIKFIYGLAGLVQTTDTSTSSTTVSNQFSLTILFHSSGDSLRYEGFLFFLIFVQISLIKRMGLLSKILQEEENTHKAYLRLKANRFIFYLAFNEQSDEGRTLPQYEDNDALNAIENDIFFEKSFHSSILQDEKPENEEEVKKTASLKEEDIQQLRKTSEGFIAPKDEESSVDEIRSDQSNYSKESEDSQFHIETEFTTEGFYKKIEEEIQHDHGLIYPQRIPNFLERVLGTVTKKPGVDLYPLIALIQVIILVYIFATYNTMTSTNDNSGISNSIASSQFSAGMVIMMIVQIVFMVWERYITLYSSEKVIDRDIERIKLAARMRKIGKSFSSNLKSIHQMEVELTELEKAAKEEEEYQKRVQEMKSGIVTVEELPTEEKKSEEHSSDKQKDNKFNFKLSQISLKYLQMVFQIIFVSFFIFYYVPKPFFSSSSTKDIIWSHYETNGALAGFYFFCCIYFILSAIQIRLGYNPFKLRNTILIKKNLISGVIAKVYRAVPFLQELKVVMDWTFTPTTLDLFQWFKIEDIHFFLFCAKVDSNSHHGIPVGQNQPKIMKIFMGWAFLVIILLLLFGPMILFSGLNPTQKLNQVTNASFELGILIGGTSGSFYQLFINQNIIQLKTVTNFTNFETIQSIQNAEDGQFQLSSPNIDSITHVLKNYLENSDNSRQIQLKMTYSIFRNVSSINSAPNTFVYPLTMYSDVNTISPDTALALYKNLKDCNSDPVYLPNFYIDLVRVDAIEDIYKVQPFPNLSEQQQTSYMQQAYLNLICKTPGDESGEKYWNLSTDLDGKQGLQFYILSDMYSSVIKGLSIVTIYTSVILVIGQLIKSIFSGDIQLLNFTEQPFSEKLIQICDAIAYSRKERDLVRENLLYWELIDLLRSPEVVKMLTGSYSKTIIAKRKRELEEIDREETRKLKQD